MEKLSSAKLVPGAKEVGGYCCETLEKSRGSTIFDINHSKIFLDLPPTVMEIKTKRDQWDPMKLKSFCTAKEITNRNPLQ